MAMIKGDPDNELPIAPQNEEEAEPEINGLESLLHIRTRVFHIRCNCNQSNR